MKCGEASPDAVPPPDPEAVGLCGTDAGAWKAEAESSLYVRINAAFASRCAEAGGADGGYPCHADAGLQYLCPKYGGSYSLCTNAVDTLIGSILDGGSCSDPVAVLQSAPGCVPILVGSCSGYLPVGDGG